MESLFRKLTLAILSMDLRESQLRDLEELLMNKSRVHDLVATCREIRGFFEEELKRSRWASLGSRLRGDYDAQALVDAVATRKDLTTKRLAEIVEWACGRNIPPGRSGKAAYLRSLARILTKHEIEKVAQKISEVPRSGSGRETDEWFQQMARRVRDR